MVYKNMGKQTSPFEFSKLCLMVKASIITLSGMEILKPIIL